MDIAERHGIQVISWTCEDRVVWHEFVTETACLAQGRGIINLYESACFISPEAVEALIRVIDMRYASINPLDTYVLAGQATGAPVSRTLGVETPRRRSVHGARPRRCSVP
ncbi:hypothetical protein [Nocardiopsis sp. CNR-923]|uniref:hypothetical protein n=1 Tax=Nocardiopsis sp. CNR-923 TaxID=1904965 RepID=UPI0016514BDA|nr:hypothetical protein [Nocardiopsis sp. CNR-923]